VIAALEPLDKSALKNILTQPKNALIKQYKRLFELEGIEIEFDNAVVDFIVDKAFEYQLGARGLRGICEAILLDYMYEAPSAKNNKKIKVTLKDAQKKWDIHKIAISAA
jgi:ATP-dependent Clp protease ATP-binding subunit ClpX